MSEEKYSIAYLELAHKTSFGDKAKIIEGDNCACFHCLKIFCPNEITEWIIENDNQGETAMCPYCGIDSVVSSEWPFNDTTFLKQMHSHYFKSNIIHPY